MYNETTLLTLSVACFFLVCNVTASVAEEDFLSEDDILFEEEIDTIESHWTDSLKTTIQHSQSVTTKGIETQRSTIRSEFEQGFGKGWFVKLDSKFRYFWNEDSLAKQRGESYANHRWQQVWLQYSAGSCAVKAGRQTLFWGEVEGTFAVDVVSPFDYTEQLLTDYANIGLAQDMGFLECFSEQLQAQLFYIPDAEADLYRHNDSQYPVQFVPGGAALDMHVDPGREFGGRLKWLGEGYDISLMIAQLYSNSPAIVIDGVTPTAKVVKYDFYGFSSSVAKGRLLLKLDMAYKAGHLLTIEGNTVDRYDLAAGFEYTTSNNHNFNSGVWRIEYADNDTMDNSDVVSVGWSKTYFNDDLSMSLLGSWASDPEIVSVTIQGQYQWDDYWNASLALGFADSDDVTKGTPLYRPDESLLFSIMYEF